MRITGGTLRGRILAAPKNQDIRPTSDKVRLAVFNMLNARGFVEGAIVMDAFCGTGALGIEALSWGAAECIFVDKNRTSLDLTKKNCSDLGLVGNIRFLLKDSAKIGSKPAEIPAPTLIFLDPPYRKNLVPECIQSLEEHGWISHTLPEGEGPVLVLETEDEFDEGQLGPMGYGILQTKNYGDTKIVLAQK